MDARLTTTLACTAPADTQSIIDKANKGIRQARPESRHPARKKRDRSAAAPLSSLAAEAPQRQRPPATTHLLITTKYSTDFAPGRPTEAKPLQSGLAKPDSSAYRDPRIDFLDSSRPESRDVQRIQAHGATNPSTTEKYKRYWNIFRRYCEDNNWDPYVFSIELATALAGAAPRGPS